MPTVDREQQTTSIPPGSEPSGHANGANSHHSSESEVLHQLREMRIFNGDNDWLTKSLIPISEFDGKNIPVENFISDIQFALQTIDLEDHSKFTYLIFAKLKGNARRQLVSKRASYVSPYQLISDLRNLYSTRKTTLSLKMELANMAQGTYESINDFAARVNQIVDILDRRASQAIHRDPIIIAQMRSENAANGLESFITGLHDDLSRYVYSKEPNSINIAIDYAYEAENQNRSRSRVKYNRAKFDARSNRSTPIPDDVDIHSSETEFDEKPLKSSMKRDRNRERGSHHSNRRSRSRSSTRVRIASAEEVDENCRYCKKFGHSIENCFKLQNRKYYEQQEKRSNRRLNDRSSSRESRDDRPKHSRDFSRENYHDRRRRSEFHPSSSRDNSVSRSPYRRNRHDDAEYRSRDKRNGSHSRSERHSSRSRDDRKNSRRHAERRDSSQHRGRNSSRSRDRSSDTRRYRGGSDSDDRRYHDNSDSDCQSRSSRRDTRQRTGRRRRVSRSVSSCSDVSSDGDKRKRVHNKVSRSSRSKTKDGSRDTKRSESRESHTRTTRDKQNDKTPDSTPKSRDSEQKSTEHLNSERARRQSAASSNHSSAQTKPEPKSVRVIFRGGVQTNI